jgi:predicted enzyme related to lactoylglutathione lyase
MTATTNPVTSFEIYVDELERARSFYEAVFICTLIPEKTDGSFEAYRLPGGMPGNGATGCLMKHPMRKPFQEGTLVYFHCDDCEILSVPAQRNVGQVFKAKWRIGKDGYIAVIGNTEGNAIGLHSFK